MRADLSAAWDNGYYLQVANNLSDLLTCSGIWLTVCRRLLIMASENAGTCCSLHLFSKMLLSVPPASLQDGWIPPTWDWAPLTLYPGSHQCRNQIQERLYRELSCSPRHPSCIIHDLVFYLRFKAKLHACLLHTPADDVVQLWPIATFHQQLIRRLVCLCFHKRWSLHTISFAVWWLSTCDALL